MSVEGREEATCAGTVSDVVIGTVGAISAGVEVVDDVGRSDMDAAAGVSDCNSHVSRDKKDSSSSKFGGSWLGTAKSSKSDRRRLGHTFNGTRR